MRRHRRENVGAPEVAKVTDPAARYSELKAKLSDVEQALHQMSRELNIVQYSSGIALEKNCNFSTYGIPEPFMKDGKQKEGTVSHHVINVLRKVEIPERVAVKRVLRLRRWHTVREYGCRDPRPTLADIINPRHGDRFLALADRNKRIASGVITIKSDENAIRKIKAKDARGFARIH